MSEPQAQTTDERLIELGKGQICIGGGTDDQGGYFIRFSRLPQRQEIGSKVEAHGEMLCTIRMSGTEDINVLKRVIEHVYEHSLQKPATWVVASVNYEEIPHE